MIYSIEVCANSVQSVLNAEAGGAQRVELCDNLWEGGTTPSMAAIELSKEKSKLELFVLVRPRGGDFVYSPLELQIIKRDIELAKTSGASGIVSGVLLPNGNVDVVRTKELVELAAPLPFTFHRAFDLTPEPIPAMEDIISCGASRILTSGQRNTALEGIETIKQLLSAANKRIIILPGGGLNEINIQEFIDAGCMEFHLSAKSMRSGLAEYESRIRMNGSLDIPEDGIVESDVKKIKAINQVLEHHH